ncbi:hypothetical protein D3C87_1286440 [compost metagenome]
MLPPRLVVEPQLRLEGDPARLARRYVLARQQRVAPLAAPLNAPVRQPFVLAAEHRQEGSVCVFVDYLKAELALPAAVLNKQLYRKQPILSKRVHTA